MDHFAARTWCPAGQSEGDAPAPDIRRSGCRNLEPAPIGDRRIFDAHAPHPTAGNPHPTTAISWGPGDLRSRLLRSSVTYSSPNTLPPVLPPHEAGFVGTPDSAPPGTSHPTKSGDFAGTPERGTWPSNLSPPPTGAAS